eukprot:Platyproteum_vivax@DN7023_c0_g1_i2.p1
MKFNISNPPTGQQKTIEVDDDRKILPFIDRRMGQDVSADALGDEFKGYVFRITGGNDKQGFPMKQGVLLNHRVRLLLDKNHNCYRPRRKGERKRKSIRGCIVGHDLAVIALAIVKKGTDDIPGLTDEMKPNRRGPKRASKIIRMFGKGYSNADAVKMRVYRKIETGSKIRWKKPKIQRLVTDQRLARKARLRALVITRKENTAAAKMEFDAQCAKLRAVRMEKRMEEAAKKKKKLEAKTGPKQAPKAKAGAKKTAVAKKPAKKV